MPNPYPNPSNVLVTALDLMRGCVEDVVVTTPNEALFQIVDVQRLIASFDAIERQIRHEMDCRAGQVPGVCVLRITRPLA